MTMGSRPVRWAITCLTALAFTVTTFEIAQAQLQTTKGKADTKAGARSSKSKSKNKARRRDPARKAMPAIDLVENPNGNGNGNADPDAMDKAATGMVHYRLKIKANDDTNLNMLYYPAFPARLGTDAPVIMLVHEKERSSRDFEEPIAELKKQGFAEHLQSIGYAVLSVDLRGHGANVRKPLTTQDWRLMIDDLQASYQFLLDRHNRGKLNLAKLGVVGIGEGANLVAAWANMPGGAVSGEGRTSDLGALVLISPLADGQGLLLRQVLSSLAPRIPLLVMAGERDASSIDPVRAIRPIVERPAGGMKLNKVEVFDSSLHGYKLLWLEPKVTSSITKFLEGTVKLKATAPWEPRYNLTPVEIDYNGIQLVRSSKDKLEPEKVNLPEPEKKAEPEKKDEAGAKP